MTQQKSLYETGKWLHASSGLAPGPLNLEKAVDPRLTPAALRLIMGMSIACGLLLLSCLVSTLWALGLLECVPVEVSLHRKLGRKRHALANREHVLANIGMLSAEHSLLAGRSDYIGTRQLSPWDRLESISWCSQSRSIRKAHNAPLVQLRCAVSRVMRSRVGRTMLILAHKMPGS